MAAVATKLTTGWRFRSRMRVYARVRAFRVAQGHTVPFFGEDVGTKLEII
jgi:hypothetical protein